MNIEFFIHYVKHYFQKNQKKSKYLNNSLNLFHSHCEHPESDDHDPKYAF